MADTLSGCGTWLHFREWLESGETRLRNANFCKNHLICRACAARRAGKLVEAYMRKVAEVQRLHPDLIPAHVTITVKNGPDLKERVDHLKKAWQRMLARRRSHLHKPERYGPVEWCKVAGSVRSLEVTAGAEGWHPHFHAFVLLKEYIDHEQLCEEWRELTGDSFIVGVSLCRDGVLPGLIEVLKYATKFSELKPAQAWHVFQCLRGSRSVDPQGVLRGVMEPNIDQDTVDGLSGPYRDFIAIWSNWKRGYNLHGIEDLLPDQCDVSLDDRGHIQREPAAAVKEGDPF